MQDYVEILDDIRDTLKDIAETVALFKWMLYVFMAFGAIALIKDIIKWFAR